MYFWLCFLFDKLRIASHNALTLLRAEWLLFLNFLHVTPSASSLKLNQNRRSRPHFNQGEHRENATVCVNVQHKFNAHKNQNSIKSRGRTWSSSFVSCSQHSIDHWNWHAAGPFVTMNEFPFVDESKTIKKFNWRDSLVRMSLSCSF